MKRRGIALAAMAAALLLMTGAVMAHPHCCPQGPCCGGGGAGWGEGPGPRWEDDGGSGFGPEYGPGPGFREGRPGRGPGRGWRHDGPRRGAWGPRGRDMYNPASEEVLEGEVVRVEVGRGQRGPRGVHVWLDSDDEFIPVLLGPAWYLKDQSVKLEKGDRIIVRGSRVDNPRGPALIAAEFRKDDRLVTLRDEEGVPRWARRHLAD